MRTTVEDHGCTGKGRHAMRTTTQRFSRPMPLLLLYRAPSFGCSLFFVHRGLCKNRSIDVHGRTQCLHVNIYGPQLLYSFGQVFFYAYRECLAYVCVFFIRSVAFYHFFCKAPPIPFVWDIIFHHINPIATMISETHFLTH